jgi:hypothetical protein
MFLILSEKLLQKTKAGKAIWKKTSRDGQFKITLDSGIIMIHPSWTNGDRVCGFYVVTVLDRNGDDLATHHISFGDGFISELYAAITHQAGELANGVYEAMIRELDEQDEPDEPDRLIRDCDELSSRARTLLIRNGINTVSELLDGFKDAKDLLKFRYLGYKTADEIERFIKGIKKTD